MERAVLPDNGPTVDTDYLPVREGFANDSQGLVVEVGLSISRTEHGTVDDEKVGIGGRQPVFSIIDGMGHWQFLQGVGLAVEGAEGL